MGRRSKEYMKQEMEKCTADPLYFLLTYGKVRHPKRGIIPFDLYDYQIECLKNYIKSDYNIILKSRQTGLSTITAGYIAWLLIFFGAKEIAVVANKQKSAQGFIRKVKLIIKQCPSWMVPRITSDNKGSIELSNLSKVDAESTTSDSARSESLSLLVIDEAAAIDTHKVNDLWAAASPTLSLGGSAIVISTPKGVGNWYHKQWESAIQGQSEFVPFTAHWSEHPEFSMGMHRDDEGNLTSPWYEAQKKRLLYNKRLIAQEYDMSFLGSGDQVIEEDVIKKLEVNLRPPIEIRGFDNNLWVWENPIQTETYIITADVGRGDGGDYSTTEVIKLSNKEQVAEYKGYLPPDMFAKFLSELGLMYNTAIIAVEANSIGLATCLKLEEIEYPNIYYSMRGAFTNRNTRQIERAFNNGTSSVPGFQTTSTTRPLAISHLEEAIRTQTLIVHSTRFISELRTFIWKNGKQEALTGYHDDLIMAMAIAMLIISTTLNDMISARESIIASIRAIKGYSSKVDDEISVSNAAFIRRKAKENPWQIITKQGTTEDLSWLL